MIQIEGRQIDCVDSGEGPALLFLPGSYSTPAAWRPVQRLLQPSWRLITTSLCGYGGSSETRTRQDFGMAHEVRLVEALVERIASPVHLIGHSFGAAVALATALDGKVNVASLTLFEANPLEIMRERGHEALYQDTLRMSRDFEAAVDGGEADAPRRIIDFWGNPGAWTAMPEPVKAYCRDTAARNVLDWRAAFAYKPGAAEFAGVDVPVLVVRGGLANAAMVQITDGLLASLPRARAAVVQGAGHFLITSHPAPCAELLTSFLAETS
jgi:pimeloyl-ACP methyl ester carboxylesterase